jgi:hypothetical protein
MTRSPIGARRDSVTGFSMEISGVAEDLVSSASDLTLRALDSAAVQDWRSFYLLGGMGLEHLAKARLATEHPTFIVDRGDFDSMLVLNTSERLRPSDASRVRTVGLLEALRRCAHRSLIPPLAALLEDLGRIASRRNSVAHVGVVDSSSTDEDLLALLRATDILLNSFPIERASYYRDFMAFVDARIANAISAARVQAVFAVAAAKRRSVRIQVPVDYHILTESYSSMFGDRDGVFVTCPACTNTAYIDGPMDDNDFIECVNLQCHACDLELNLEELLTLGVPARCHMEEITEGQWDGLTFHKGQ